VPPNSRLRAARFPARCSSGDRGGLSRTMAGLAYGGVGRSRSFSGAGAPCTKSRRAGRWKSVTRARIVRVGDHTRDEPGPLAILR